MGILARTTGSPLSDDPLERILLNTDLAYMAILKQIRDDRSGARLARLASAADYSDAYWQACLKGQIARREAHRILHLKFGAHNVPLPTIESGFRPEMIIWAAAQWLGLEVVQSNDELTARADERTGRADPERTAPVYAWLMTFPMERRPKVYVRKVPPDVISYVAFDAACVLGLYDLLRPYLTGPVLGEFKPLPDPADDTVFTPCLHRYAKSLLWLTDTCSPTSTCSCNDVAALINARPAGHPLPTGTLSLEHLQRQMAEDKIRLIRPGWGPSPDGPVSIPDFPTA